MKKAVLFLLLMMFMCSDLYAADKVIYQSKGLVNGKYWNEMEYQSKLDFISGLITGIKFCADTEIQFGKEKVDLMTISRFRNALLSLLPGDITFEDMIKYIDTFFSEKENQGIPITSAYVMMVDEKRKPLDQERRAQIIKSLRKTYSE